MTDYKFKPGDLVELTKSFPHYNLQQGGQFRVLGAEGNVGDCRRRFILEGVNISVLEDYLKLATDAPVVPKFEVGGEVEILEGNYRNYVGTITRMGMTYLSVRLTGIGDLDFHPAHVKPLPTKNAPSLPLVESFKKIYPAEAGLEDALGLHKKPEFKKTPLPKKVISCTACGEKHSGGAINGWMIMEFPVMRPPQVLPNEKPNLEAMQRFCPPCAKKVAEYAAHLKDYPPARSDSKWLKKGRKP